MGEKRAVLTARQAAVDAIKSKLSAYHETGIPVHATRQVNEYLKNPDFAGFLFAYVNVAEAREMEVA